MTKRWNYKDGHHDFYYDQDRAFEVTRPTGETLYLLKMKLH